jgi:hypothetical protein
MMSQIRRALVAVMFMGVITLVPHGSAFAGHPVDPATLTPPPLGATCWSVGEGTNGALCKVIFNVLDPEGPSGIVCGSGAQSVELLSTDSGVRVGTRFYNQDGNLTRRLVRQDVTGTFTNPLTGASASFVTRVNWINVLAVPGDFSSATTANDGSTRVYLPHGGTILVDAGREVDAPDGTPLSDAGQHPFTAYYVFGDSSAMEPLCAALA